MIRTQRSPIHILVFILLNSCLRCDKLFCQYRCLDQPPSNLLSEPGGPTLTPLRVYFCPGAFCGPISRNLVTHYLFSHSTTMIGFLIFDCHKSNFFWYSIVFHSIPFHFISFQCIQCCHTAPNRASLFFTVFYHHKIYCILL